MSEPRLHDHALAPKSARALTQLSMAPDGNLSRRLKDLVHLRDDAQIAELTFTVGAIRAWNMLNASFHTPVPETPYVAG